MTTTQIPPTTTNDTTPEEPAPGLYGPRGWTTRTPLWYLLRTFPTQPVYQPDGSLLPGYLLTDGAPREEYVTFAGLTCEAALDLLEWLPAQALEDRQNNGPTLRSLLRACAASGDRLLLCGYGIGPQRSDERVSVEALWLRDEDLGCYRVSPEHDAGCQCENLWKVVAARYQLDAAAVPDEILRMAPPWGGGESGWWFWWD